MYHKRAYLENFYPFFTHYTKSKEKWYLVSDFGLECYDDQWNLYRGYATLMIVSIIMIFVPLLSITFNHNQSLNKYDQIYTYTAA